MVSPRLLDVNAEDHVRTLVVNNDDTGAALLLIPSTYLGTVALYLSISYQNRINVAFW